MRLAHSIALAVLAGAASVLPAAAATRSVPQQYPTIQAALNAAVKGDTILVSPKSGADPTYHEALTIRKGVVLQGQNGATLDGTGLGALVTDPFGGTMLVLPDGIDIKANHVAVRSLTVQNFAGDPFNDTSAIAAGFFNDDFSAFTSKSDIEISGCTIRNNHNGISIIGFNGDNPYFGTGTTLSGYNILNDTVTGNANYGVSVLGLAVTVTGNKIAQNGFSADFYTNLQFSSGDGLDVFGSGLTVAANELSGNYGAGIGISAARYNPAVNNPHNPNPSPSTVALNSVHDNGNFGLAVSGTVVVSANSAYHNTGYGIYLAAAGYSTVALNSSTNNVPSVYASPGDPYQAGVGIYADYDSYDPTTFAPDPLTISANQISGNASDGIALNAIDRCLVSLNSVTGNSGIGIHASDQSGYAAPNTITLNTAQRNTPFDAQDDVVLAGGPATNNVWTRNSFGSTNPPNLSH